MRAEFVAPPVPVHVDYKTVRLAQVVSRGQRTHRGKATVVRQRHCTAEHRHAVVDSKAAGGQAAHHVVVDDLPRGIGRGLEIENSFLRGRMRIHGEAKNQQQRFQSRENGFHADAEVRN